MFSRRHYQAIARVFQEECPGKNWNANKRVEWELLRKGLADMFARDNGSFQRERFFQACEPEENEEELEEVDWEAMKPPGWLAPQ